MKVTPLNDTEKTLKSKETNKLNFYFSLIEELK